MLELPSVKRLRMGLETIGETSLISGYIDGIAEFMKYVRGLEDLRPEDFEGLLDKIRRNGRISGRPPRKLSPSGVPP